MSQVKKVFDGFEEEMSVRGIGSISEIYDGNPPHMAKGAISTGYRSGCPVKN